MQVKVYMNQIYCYGIGMCYILVHSLEDLDNILNTIFQVPAHALQQGGASGSTLQQVLTQAITQVRSIKKIYISINHFLYSDCEALIFGCDYGSSSGFSIFSCVSGWASGSEHNFKSIFINKTVLLWLLYKRLLLTFHYPR